MKIDEIVVDNTKNTILETTTRVVTELQDRVVLELMNLELAILYQNKAYGHDMEIISDIFLKLLEDIDKAFNELYHNFHHEIGTLLDRFATSRTIYS